VTAYLLLGALAWAVAARGGTGLRDVVVVLTLLVIACIVGRAWPRRDVELWAAFAALMSWLVLAGPLRMGLTFESVRVPLLVAIAALTALLVRRMSDREQDVLVNGLVVVGSLEALVALVELAVTASTGVPVVPRVGALLGSPNGLGMLLVGTAVLTVREFNLNGGRLPLAALLLQGGALLSTGSRTAILTGSVLLVGYVATHSGWKPGVIAAAGVIGGVAIVIWRTATEPQQGRLLLWLESLRRIADQPLLGEGPAPAPYTSGARVTTHAHNEFLQWGVEYGLVGLALGLVVLVLAFRSARVAPGVDRWIPIAALVLLVAGLTDFTLRITALTLTAAILATMAATGRTASSSSTGWSTAAARQGFRGSQGDRLLKQQAGYPGMLPVRNSLIIRSVFPLVRPA
jgi:O-antigen ligase